VETPAHPPLTAVILCGGKGQRMGPDAPPKCLTPILGKPILGRIVEHLAPFVSRFLICVGHRAGEVERWLYDQPFAGVTSNAGETASMLARLIHARPLIDPASPFLVCYGDECSDVDIAALRAKHAELSATVTVTAVQPRCDFGVLEPEIDLDRVPTDRVWTFLEKPILPLWVNIGFMMMSGTAFDSMSPDGEMDFLLRALTETRQLGLYRHKGLRFTVNTPRDVELAEVRLAE